MIIVVPEKGANIEKFKLEIESRWVKMNGDSINSGFSIIVPFKGKELGQYLDYLSKVNPPADADSNNQKAGGQEVLTLIDSAE
jgi:hypothetical protein